VEEVLFSLVIVEQSYRSAIFVWLNDNAVCHWRWTFCFRPM